MRPVPRLGNAVEDKSVISMALGNLGLIYRTRGDLEKGEEYHLKALALNEELGRKEGMANQFGNLGNLANDQSEKATACGHWATARRLFAEVGIPDKVALIEGWMTDAGCPTEDNAGEPGPR